MLALAPMILTGKYVQLEPLHANHFEMLKQISEDEKISTYSPALRLKFDTWFHQALKQYPEYPQLSFAARTRHDQKLVGSTRLYEIHPEHKRLAIGYTWYIPDVWGTHVNTECKLLLLQYAFESLNINRVEFCIDTRNARSRAAVKKLGAVEEGVLREHLILEDEYVRDTVVYSLLKREWPMTCARLMEKL